VAADERLVQDFTARGDGEARAVLNPERGVHLSSTGAQTRRKERNACFFEKKKQKTFTRRPLLARRIL
jgi:hypothetical protein